MLELLKLDQTSAGHCSHNHVRARVQTTFYGIFMLFFQQLLEFELQLKFVKQSESEQQLVGSNLSIVRVRIPQQLVERGTGIQDCGISAEGMTDF